MFAFLANITLNQIAFTATVFEALKSIKNGFLALLDSSIGHYERQPAHFHPQDLDENALSDQEQHSDDKREMLLQASKTGLCLLTAYNLAQGRATQMEMAVGAACMLDAGKDLLKFAYRKL